jgi:hypothetical protein
MFARAAQEAWAAGTTRAVRPAEPLLRGVLFITIASSFFVYVEPAPYEALVALLAIVCVAAGVGVDRKLTPLIALLALWNLGGLLALTQVATDEDAIRFTAVSVYLALTAIIFACLFQNGSLVRLKVMRTAYMIAAGIAVAVGVAAYFQIIPAEGTFMLFGRVRSTFKDPNVFGPFLVVPMLFAMHALIARRFDPRQGVILAWLGFGLLLSFSRGAWANFFTATLALFALMFLTAPHGRARAKIIALCALAVLMLIATLAVAVSLDSVREMFELRARLTQDYDVGSSGRFTGHLESIPRLLERPNGFGPLQFADHIGWDAHQVYIQAFASYGWLGGVSFIALNLATLALGLRAVMIRTPWQPYLVVAMAAFTGIAVEGFVIDTDHWRHLYLVLGLIWGLAVATFNASARGQSLVLPALAPTTAPAGLFRVRLP